MHDPVSESTPATAATQGEMPFAIVQGAPITELPKDLYIPPEALQVFLEAFEGPLDLLLYLIKRQNLNILDIPIARITEQYMQYIELMQDMQLELVGEYLLMAAMLAEIKSRMLLPRPVESDDEEDPRAELVRRLQEYERYKQAAEDLDQLPRFERDIFGVIAEFPYRHVNQPQPTVELNDLLLAFADVLKRADMFTHHHISREPLSVRERMSMVMGCLNPDNYVDFSSLFTVEEGRAGVVVTLLAILELIKESLVELMQNEINGPIYIKSRAE
ncbi:MAG: ScpA family protein [Gammaproteobacteria bacterium]